MPCSTTRRHSFLSGMSGGRGVNSGSAVGAATAFLMLRPVTSPLRKKVL